MKIVYADNPESRFLKESIQWAENALKKPDQTYPNGRSMHEVANETIEQSMDSLVDHMCIQVTPQDTH